jgi:hypothetical protein
MRRLTLQFALVLVILLAAALTVSMALQPEKPEKQEPIKGEKISLTGQLSCTFCSLAHPDQPCKKDCCAGCIKAGDPALLTDAAGNMYILLGSEIKKPVMTPERMEMAGGKVSVKGLLVKGKGVQAIFVDSMEKAEAAAGEKKAEEEKKGEAMPHQH